MNDCDNLKDFRHEVISGFRFQVFKLLVLYVQRLLSD
jgi:hypothetical protein